MSLWNTDQQRWLGALGVTVFERAVVAAVKSAPHIDPAVQTTHAALQAALERAAGGRNLAELLLDLPRIRASGAAKRALWPTLRALRRRG